jgi:hypothetical protein
MALEFQDSKVLKGIQKKVEEEMTRKEMESLLYWKGELEKVVAKRSDSLATLRLEIQNYIQRMQNRIKMLKGTLSG